MLAGYHAVFLLTMILRSHFVAARYWTAVYSQSSSTLSERDPHMRFLWAIFRPIGSKGMKRLVKQQFNYDARMKSSVCGHYWRALFRSGALCLHGSQVRSDFVPISTGTKQEARSVRVIFAGALCNHAAFLASDHVFSLGALATITAWMESTTLAVPSRGP
jgi:hypothetical protein